MTSKNYSKFMSAKLKYSGEDLLKRVLSEYYSIIEIFMKSNVDVVAKHKEQWDLKIHLKKSKERHLFETISLFWIQRLLL